MGGVGRYRFVGSGYDVAVSYMFDIDGDETDDPEQATSIVGQLPDGTWFSACRVNVGDLVEDRGNGPRYRQ